MSSSQWEQVKDVFDRLAALTPDQQRDGLAQLPDPEIAAEVRRLLEAQAAGGGLLDQLLAIAQPFHGAVHARAFAPGEVVAQRFRIVRFLAAGGMGEVYEAEDLQLGEPVALKTARPEHAAEPRWRELFVREIQLARKISHPNVCRIHDLWTHGHTLFFTMELLQGETLAERIRQQGAFSPVEAQSLLAQMAAALDAAHAAGVIHRDFKSGNVMLVAGPDGQTRATVTDFGLSRALTGGTTGSGGIGTPDYMAPEQIEGKPATPSSDIYALGIVAYEMVAGAVPFRSSSPIAAALKKVREEVVPPRQLVRELPPVWDSAIVRALARDPQMRFRSAGEFAQSLCGEWAGRLPVRPSRRSFRPWPAAIAALLLLAGGLSGWWWWKRAAETRVTRVGPLNRVSPEDDKADHSPTLSPDGKFMAYVSDRQGPSDDLWLQQLGVGEAIRLTNNPEMERFPAFLPDGKRLVFVKIAAEGGGNASIESIPLLGGQPRILLRTGAIRQAKLSPDGKSYLFLEVAEEPRVKILNLADQSVSELKAWFRTYKKRGTFSTMMVWTADSRHVLYCASSRSNDSIDWLVAPVHGDQDSVETGSTNLLKQAGLSPAFPSAVFGDRIFFNTLANKYTAAWALRLVPDSWRAEGPPHQVLTGTSGLWILDINPLGDAAVVQQQVSRDIYLLPLDPSTALPTGPAQRLTKDGRMKNLVTPGGPLDTFYFTLMEADGAKVVNSFQAVNLARGGESSVISLPANWQIHIPARGPHYAYSTVEPDGKASFRLGLAGEDPRRSKVICDGCGVALGFSVDSRFLFFNPGPGPARRAKTKVGVHLYEIATGRITPWFEHATESVIQAVPFGTRREWIVLGLMQPGKPMHPALVPWRSEPMTMRDVIPIELPGREYRAARAGDCFLSRTGARLFSSCFDARTKRLLAPQEVNGGPAANEGWTTRGPGLVFTRSEARSSVWHAKLQ